MLCLMPALTYGQEEAVSVRVTGVVLINGFHTSKRSPNVDIPPFVTPVGPADSLGDGDGLGMTARQTRLGVIAFWPDVAGGELRAEVDADFYGGQQASNFGDNFPLLHLRRAVAELSWHRASILVGQEVPLISEYNPSSFATMGLSGFGSSGNLWLWLPQFRGALHLVRTSNVRLSVEGAVMAPSSSEAAGELMTQPDRAEQSDRPYLQSRAILRWGNGDRSGDISVGGHLGWLATTSDALLKSRAFAVAARIPLVPTTSITGEWFDGQALAGLGGGGIGQNTGPGDVAVPSRGGWAQFEWKPLDALALSVGYGEDDPDDAYLGAAARLRNRVTMTNLILTPGPLVIALEYRGLNTSYRSGDLKATHLNLAVGVRF